MAKSVKTLSVYIKLNSKAFETGLRKMQTKLNRFGKTMSNIGSKMTSSITMPMIAVGGGAIKLASDFESSMTKIQTLVGLPVGEVEKLKESVKELSGQTAQSPKDLADGLYFLTSAGLDSESAMRALESVSKGVAIGLGEQTDLAKVAAAAQNAYGEDVLSSSDALDIFGQMVRTGMFEAGELANVLGTQLGLASNLGISMEELGAMISTYTRTTGDANAATTGLSGVMMAFAKITPKQTKALEDVGLTTEQVRKSLGEQGLQKTLFMLNDRFKENNIDLSEFFSKSQALKGVLGVLGTQTESYTNILDEMHKSQGFVNDSFEVTSQTSAFKFQQALSDLKTAGVELGTAIMPIATKIAGKISELATKFSNMSTDAQKGFIKTAAAIALLGPALSIIGALSTAFATLIGFVRTLGIVSKASALFMALFNPFTYVFLGLGVILAGMIKHFDNLKEPIVKLVNSVIKWYNEITFVKIAVESIGFAFGYIWESAQFLFNFLVDGFKGVGKILLNLFDKDARNLAIDELLNDISGNFDDFSNGVQKKWDKAVENVQQRKLEPITKEDIDKGVEKGKEWVNSIVDGVKSGAGKLQDALSNALFSGGGVLPDPEEEDDYQPLDPSEIETIDITGDIQETFGEKTKEPIFQWSDEVKEKFASTFESMRESLQNFTLDYSLAFADMVATTITEGGNLAENFKNFVVDMVKQLAQLLIKMVVFKALMSALGLGAVPMGGGGGGGLFGALFGMADGGLATGPTPVMVGEGRGTTISNPEVIAPLDKLQNMIGGMGGGRLHGAISGSNILLSNQRSLISQDRVGGSITNF